jgi:predicted cupin superfamily sugar epimerase
MSAVDDIVRRLALAPHPEGGFYRETYRASLLVPTDQGPRSASTAILYLLRAGEVSALHRIRCDEVWHFHLGDPLEVCWLDPISRSTGSFTLSIDHPQDVVPAGRWFGARVLGPTFSLVGCTVAPGFDFADFELAQRDALLRGFPDHASLIHALTRTSRADHSG